MARFEDQGRLTIKNEIYVVEDLLNQLSYLNGEATLNFFTTIQLTVPRKIRITVLKSVLNDSVEKTKEERATLADEVGYRLLWFTRYTDTQLVNLLEFYGKATLSKTYLIEFWRALLSYFVEKGVSESHLIELFDLAKKAHKAEHIVLTKEFNQTINPIFHDADGEIDGLTPEEFRPVTYKSSTLTELRYIGDKYNASVPKRLKKKELLEIMISELKTRNEWTADLEAKLKEKNILVLERYCKDNDIKVSTELRKDEIIEYILANAKETKAGYYVPSSSAVYESVAPTDTVKVEEVVEVEEQVEDAAPVEEKVVEKEVYVSTGKDYTDILEKIHQELETIRTNSVGTPKQEEPKQEEPKQEEPKQEEPKQTQTKIEESAGSKRRKLLHTLLDDEADDIE